MSDANDGPRLIEVAFPLKQASLDSLHEKMCHSGHIKALHLWPARRPLAACRAALIATLLPDPGEEAERKRIMERLAGHVVERVKHEKDADGKVVEKVKEETEGGILHWGRESGPDLEWFRDEIRRVYGGRAPRVLDPFAGGGAIPLEAMRLGCKAVASDINPVAWFILKCTLEYPQKLAGQRRPLPRFALESPEFMEKFLKGQGKRTKRQLEQEIRTVQLGMFEAPEADLAWHVRAWGQWVLERARADLERFSPTIGGAPTLAYLWARTVECKACRATLPLLKTRWLCRKANKRVLLTMQPNAAKAGVVFGIRNDVPRGPGSAAQRRECDKGLGAGTMSRSGATCPCCGAIMTMEDIRFRGQAGQLGATMTTVVVEGKKGKKGKAYRLPTTEERRLAEEAGEHVAEVFQEIPFGMPDEPTPKGGSGASRAFSVDGYGLDRWHKLFTPRQLLALGTFVVHTRAAREALRAEGYPEEWVEAVTAYLACVVSKMGDYNSSLVAWQPGGEKGGHTFERWALPIKWDFSENNQIYSDSGGWAAITDWVTSPVETALPNAVRLAETPMVARETATRSYCIADIIVTDPPYYDTIPYSDATDFFYIWLRRTLHGLSPEMDAAFSEPLAPKWDHERNDGELIDDASRFDGDKVRSKAAYEEGMYRAFQACHRALQPDGRLVIVFAHKEPDAWETLVAAVIRAGFVVDASWPIQTEMANRTRAMSSAALSSSIWLVCRKRPEAARPGWDNRVLEEMRAKITTRLRDFWDAGIRGPDFVWAATGPAMEAYSRYPAVRLANEPNQTLSVSAFLKHVRRMVVDFVVGRLLSPTGTGESNQLDDVTTYYLLHRQNFQYDEAPVGASILYAVSCNLSEGDLVSQYDLLTYGNARAVTEEPEEGDDDEGSETNTEPEESGSRATLRLKKWRERRGKKLGMRLTAAGPVPLIDRVHRLMHLWRAGDVTAVDDYVRSEALLGNAVFHQVLQALIELERNGNGDRALLESISNHVAALGGRRPPQQQLL